MLADEQVVSRFPEITPDLVEITIRRLRFIGEYLAIPRARFEYRRDPDDQKFIELAIDLNATHILSFDKDMLSLPGSRGDAGTRFRQRLPEVRVMDANQFIERYSAELRI